MLGPFPVVGDCVSDEERASFAFIDYAPLSHGDLGIWHMPSQAHGQQYASKWLLQDSAGEWWLACKYFAVRFRPEFHKPVARVVLIVSGEPGSLDPALSMQMSDEILELRRSPPKRADLVVFRDDILDQDRIVARIDEHRRHWAS